MGSLRTLKPENAFIQYSTRPVFMEFDLSNIYKTDQLLVCYSYIFSYIVRRKWTFKNQNFSRSFNHVPARTAKPKATV